MMAMMVVMMMMTMVMMLIMVMLMMVMVIMMKMIMVVVMKHACVTRSVESPAGRALCCLLLAPAGESVAGDGTWRRSPPPNPGLAGHPAGACWVPKGAP